MTKIKHIIRKIILLSILSVLTACLNMPEIAYLPPSSTNLRMFKVEQINYQHRLRASLLTTQFTPQQWRWVEVDPLGYPIARLLLTSKGWQKDGFVMPNSQAKMLYLALASELGLDHNQRLKFSNVTVEHKHNLVIYRQDQRFLWQVKRQSNNLYLIKLNDGSQWRIEELKTK